MTPNHSLLSPSIPSTPVHTRSSTTDKYDRRYKDRPDNLSRLADEMSPYLVGPIPVGGFLRTFLPEDGSSTPTFKKGMFKELISLIESATEPEKKLYDPFVSPDPHVTHRTCS